MGKGRAFALMQLNKHVFAEGANELPFHSTHNMLPPQRHSASQEQLTGLPCHSIIGYALAPLSLLEPDSGCLPASSIFTTGWLSPWLS